MAIWNNVEQLELPGVPNDIEQTIPKIFHLIWNHSELPESYRSHARELRDLHPGWTIEFWDDKRTSEWMKQQRSGDLAYLIAMLDDAYSKVNDKRQVSDLLRLGLVKRYGGVYLDFDYTPLKNLEPLLGGASCVLTCPSSRNIANGLIAAVPNDHFIECCLSALSDSYYSRPSSGSQSATHRTGPRFITAQYKSFVDYYGFAPARLLEQKLCYPYTYARLDKAVGEFPDAYLAHRWGSAFEDGVYAPES